MLMTAVEAVRCTVTYRPLAPVEHVTDAVIPDAIVKPAAHRSLEVYVVVSLKYTAKLTFCSGQQSPRALMRISIRSLRMLPISN